jgi:hypothetical protein
VNAALQAAVNREKRREFADWLKDGGLPDLISMADLLVAATAERPRTDWCAVGSAGEVILETGMAELVMVPACRRTPCR